MMACQIWDSLRHWACRHDGSLPMRRHSKHAGPISRRYWPIVERLERHGVKLP